MDNVLGTTFKVADQSIGYGYIYLLFALAHFIPALAVSVRRLHDINKTGWYMLLGFIPLIGAIILLVFQVQEGTQGENQYGPDPKGGDGIELI